MSLTALGFAAWNVGASRAAGANGEHTISPSSFKLQAQLGDTDRLFLYVVR
jgi:hypothetical protein